MLPLSVSDIVKLLEQIPIWKSIVGLPKKIAELEHRVGELEQRSKIIAKPSTPGDHACPMCGATMKVIDENSHPQFGVFGVKLLTMECPNCKHKTTRDFDPAKGSR